MNIWATFKQIAVTTFGNFWKQFGYFSFKHLVTLPPPLMHQYYVSATLLLVYHREIKYFDNDNGRAEWKMGGETDTDSSFFKAAANHSNCIIDH